MCLDIPGRTQPLSFRTKGVLVSLMKSLPGYFIQLVCLGTTKFSLEGPNNGSVPLLTLVRTMLVAGVPWHTKVSPSVYTSALVAGALEKATVSVASLRLSSSQFPLHAGSAYERHPSHACKINGGLWANALRW